jgi:glutathionylspermidine synthase
MTTLEFRAGRALDGEAYDELIRRSIFDCCKWNLTAGDDSALCRFPILIKKKSFAQLSRVAEGLAAEALAAERELLSRPELHAGLGIPQRIARLFRTDRETNDLRFLRVDFHPTPDGYRITEGNTDVAGGFIEGSGISAIWARLAGRHVTGDPAGALAAAFVQKFGPMSRVGFLHLSRYTDDRQVVAYLARRFEAAGLKSVLFDAMQLRSDLNVIVGEGGVSLNAIFRFFPGEWLEQLPPATHWKELVLSGSICNPVTAMLTQSKRFPLVWAQLKTPMKTWRALLPETVSPDDLDRYSPEWVLKPALGHEGFGISISGVTTDDQNNAAKRHSRRFPLKWAAQRRFQFMPIETPDGPRFACLGVYVVDGRAAGAYARIGKTPFINGDVQDAVVLLEDS